MSTAANAVTTQEWKRVQRRALLAGVAGLGICLLGAWFSPAHFFRAYLVSFNFWLGIALGSLLILMLQYLTGGAWGILLRRALEAAVATIPLLAVLFLPLLGGLHLLYSWAGTEDPRTGLGVQERFPERTLLPGAGRRLFLDLDRARLFPEPVVGTTGRNLESRSGPQASAPQCAGLVLFALTITVASIDWVMSLEPHWSSTIFPVLFAAGQGLEGMAFAVAVLILLAARLPLADVVQPAHRRDLGNLLLMFVMFWAYLSFSQFLLIWAENLPEEIPWYLRRLRDGWQWVAVLLILLQFGVPFLLLLSRQVKESPQGLAYVAMLVLAMRVLDLIWWVEASFVDGMSLYLLFDVAALVGLGGIWLWWFLWRFRQRPLLPLHDPYLAEYLPEGVRHE